MHRAVFIHIMQRMKLQYKKRENYLNKIEEFFGMKMVEDIYETDFFNILIDTIEVAIEDKGKNISYLAYECGFDLNTYCEKVETKEGHPKLNDFGDFYDFITREEN